MKTTTLTAHIGEDGILKIELPSDVKNTTVEVVVIVHPVESTDAKGYPPDFFEQIDAIKSDDLIERPEQGFLSDRDSVE